MSFKKSCILCGKSVSANSSLLNRRAFYDLRKENRKRKLLFYSGVLKKDSDFSASGQSFENSNMGVLRLLLIEFYLILILFDYMLVA